MFFAMFSSPLMPAILLSVLAHIALLALLLNNAYTGLFEPKIIAQPPGKPITVTFSRWPTPTPAIPQPSTPVPEVVAKSPPKPSTQPKARPKPAPVAKSRPRPKPEKKVALKPQPQAKPAPPKKTVQPPEPEPAAKPSEPTPPPPTLATVEPPPKAVTAIPQSVPAITPAPATTTAALDSDGVLKQVIRKPGYRSKPKAPRYPRKARRKRQQGTVNVRVLVSESGTNLEVKIFRSSGFDILDEAALEAVKDWRFKPATADGKLVMAWVEVPVEFKLRKN